MECLDCKIGKLAYLGERVDFPNSYTEKWQCTRCGMRWDTEELTILLGEKPKEK